MAKMIVLGNGFDLSSDLKSSYSNFMEYRLTQEMKDVLSNFYESTFNITSNGSSHVCCLKFKDSRRSKNGETIHLDNIECVQELNFWDIFLFYKYNKSGLLGSDKELPWYNIEEDILNFIYSTTYNKNTTYHMMKKEISIYDFNTIKKRDLERAIWVSNALMYKIRHTEDYTNTKILNFLQDELRKFENSFKSYIKSEVQKNNYIDKSHKLFEKIVASEEEEVYILNFNYTNPLKNVRENFKNRNIHGSIDDDVIFGVDANNFTPNKDEYKFTKTYRLLTETGLDNKLPLPSAIESIIFFGHSLSEADYSYFQSLFDHYNLYSSDLKLEFACKSYGNYTEKDTELNQSKLLTKLLHSYSITIPNKAHGENLIHKLLLENRLTIRIID